MAHRNFLYGAKIFIIITNININSVNIQQSVILGTFDVKKLLVIQLVWLFPSWVFWPWIFWDIRYFGLVLFGVSVFQPWLFWVFGYCGLDFLGLGFLVWDTLRWNLFWFCCKCSIFCLLNKIQFFSFCGRKLLRWRVIWFFVVMPPCSLPECVSELYQDWFYSLIPETVSCEIGSTFGLRAGKPFRKMFGAGAKKSKSHQICCPSETEGASHSSLVKFKNIIC